jgi:hypothetical protein
MNKDKICGLLRQIHDVVLVCLMKWQTTWLGKWNQALPLHTSEQKPLPSEQGEHMTKDEELIVNIMKMLEAQTKKTEITVNMLKPATDIAYQKGYADAMNWKTANHLDTPPEAQREWVGITEEDLKLLSAEWRIVYGAWMDDFARDIEAKLKEKNT